MVFIKKSSQAILLFIIVPIFMVFSIGCVTTVPPVPSVQTSASQELEATPQSAPPVQPVSRRTVIDLALRNTLTLRARNSDGEEIALGSGFFIQQGYVVTNAHVVADAAWVEIVDLDGRLISTAPYALLIDTENDLAVLPTPHADRQGLPLSESTVQIGEDVWVFGAPLGLEGSTSRGVVAALREIEGVQLIQITAPISSGSSGGPVLDERGEVIGIATLIMSGGQNLNFAVPVGSLLNQVISTESRHNFPPASAFAGISDEDFTQFIDMISALTSAPEIDIGRIYSGQIDSGSFLFNESHYSLYRFDGNAGARVQIDVMSNVFDTVIMLTSDSGLFSDSAWIQDDDDGGDGTNSRIVTVLPNDETYYLFIYSYDGTLGSYTLRTTDISPGPAGSRDERWRFVTQSQSRDKYFVDNQTLNRASQNVTAWVRQELNSPAESPRGSMYDTAFLSIEFDCANRRQRLQAVAYRSNGNSVYNEEIPIHEQAWLRVTPTTVSEVLLDAVCTR